MLNKISLPILLTVMCALLLTVVLLYGFNTGKFTFLQKKAGNQTAALTKEEEKIKRTDYTEVARKTLDWIDKQRNEEGWYILERGCDYEKKTCETVWDNKEGNKDGLIATWARLNFYEQHKDPKDLEIVKKDIDLFYDKYKDDNLKDSLWICKITYEMAQSRYLDQGQKDKLEKICFNTKFDVPENENYQEWYRGKISKIDSKILVWKTWDGYNLAVRGFDNYFSLASDFLFKYRWNSDKSDLEMARKFLDLGKKDLEDKKNTNAENLCLLGNSSVDMYEYGEKNETDLNYAKNIYETLLNNDEDRKKYQTAMCGLLSKKLYQVTRDKTFLVGMENNNRLLIGNLLDGEESYSKFVLDYGFFKTMNGGLGVPYKNVVENGLIVELIRD